MPDEIEDFLQQKHPNPTGKKKITGAEIDDILSSPNGEKIRNFFNTVKEFEGGKPNLIVGGTQTFDPNGDHPNIVGLVTKQGKSTAAGNFQITGSNWYGGLKQRLGAKNFNPENQLKAAVMLFADRDNGTGLNALLNDDYETAEKVAAKDWAALPSSQLHPKKFDSKKYNDFMRRVSGKGSVKLDELGQFLQNKPQSDELGDFLAGKATLTPDAPTQTQPEDVRVDTDLRTGNIIPKPSPTNPVNVIPQVVTPANNLTPQPENQSTGLTAPIAVRQTVNDTALVPVVKPLVVNAPRIKPAVRPGAPNTAPETGAADPTPEQLQAALADVPQDVPTAESYNQKLAQFNAAQNQPVEAKNDAEILSKGNAGTVSVDLSKKPKGVNADDFLTRSALMSEGAKFDLTTAEIDDFVKNRTDRNAEFSALTDDDIKRFADPDGTYKVPVNILNSAINQILQKRTGGGAGEINPALQTQIGLDENTLAGGLEKNQANADIVRRYDAEKAKDPLLRQAEDEIYNSPLSGGTVEEVQKRYQELKDVQLSDETKQTLAERGEYLKNNEVEVGSSDVGIGLIGGLGGIADALAGIGRNGIGAIRRAGEAIGLSPETLTMLGADNWKVLSQIGQGARIFHNSAKRDDLLGEAGDIVGRATVDIPKFVGITALTGGSGIVLFGADALAQSAGRGESVEQVAKEAAKGAIMGGIFHGASKFGDAVETGLLDKFLPKNSLTKLYKADADIELFTKLAGNAARIGTISGGTFAVAKAEGADNKAAFKQTLGMVALDLAMSGGKVGDAIDLSGKVIRLYKDGAYHDLAFARRGKTANVEIFDVTGKVPNEAIQAEIVSNDKPLDNVKNITPKPTATVEPNLTENQTVTQRETPQTKVSERENPMATAATENRLKSSDEAIQNNQIDLQPLNIPNEIKTASNEIAPSVAATENVSNAEVPPSVPAENQVKTNQSPTPERAITLAAQEKAVENDATSAIAVLYPKGENAPQIDPNKFFPAETKSGDTLIVSEKKIKKYFAENDLGTFGRGKAIRLIGEGKIKATDLIGGKAKEFENTAGGSSLVTTDGKGNELVASKISDNEIENLTAADLNVAEQQAEMDGKRFGGNVKTRIVPTSEVAESRIADRPVIKGVDVAPSVQSAAETVKPRRVLEGKGFENFFGKAKDNSVAANNVTNENALRSTAKRDRHLTAEIAEMAERTGIYQFTDNNGNYLRYENGRYLNRNTGKEISKDTFEQSFADTHSAPVEKISKLTPKQQLEIATPEFKRFFGNSKVADKNGTPFVVYKSLNPYPKKGAAKELSVINRPTLFPAFNGKEKGIEIAGFFGDSDTANRFAADGSAVYPVYLSFQNPYIYNAQGAKANSTHFGEEGVAVRNAIRSGKYDSVIIKNTADENDIYIALKPNQIKSAIGNNGRFDSADASIVRKIADTRTPEAAREQTALKNIANKADLLPNVEVRRNGSSVRLSLEAGEIARFIESQTTGQNLNEIPAIDGLTLDANAPSGNQVEAFTDQLETIANSVEDNGGDRSTLDNLRNEITAAAKENGTATLHLFDEAERHEKTHQASIIGSREAEFSKDRVKRYSNAKEILSDADFGKFRNSLERQENRKISDGAALEEALAYLGDGDFARFGLSQAQAKSILKKLITGYVEANGADSLKAFTLNDSAAIQEQIEDFHNEAKTENNGTLQSVEGGGGLDTERETGRESVRPKSRPALEREQSETRESAVSADEQTKLKKRATIESLENRGYVEKGQITGDAAYYEQVNRNETKAAAEKRVEEIGLAQASIEAKQSGDTSAEATAFKMAVSETLFAQADAARKSGDAATFAAKMNEATDVIASLAKSATAAGQANSQLAAWAKENPTAAPLVVQKQRLQQNYQTPLSGKEIEVLQKEAGEVSENAKVLDETRDKLETATKEIEYLNAALEAPKPASDIKTDLASLKRQLTYWKKKAQGEIENKKTTDKKRNATTRKVFDDLTNRQDEITARLKARFGDDTVLRMIGANSPLLAPNGKPSKLTPRQQADVQTPEFKKFFGDSKVVDTQTGEPLVVYHGTNQNIESFAKNRLGANTKAMSAMQGFFFTESPREANDYANLSAKQQIKNAEAHENKVEKLLADIDKAYDRNKFDVAERLEAQLEDLESAAINGGDEGANIVPTYLQITNPATIDFKGSYLDVERLSNVAERARMNGKDGVRILNVIDPTTLYGNAEPTNQWLVFEPNQIKSAIGNTGEFSADNDSILRKTADDRQPIIPKNIADRLKDFDDSANFQKWSGGNALRNENGDLQVFYHGTRKNVKKFDSLKGRDYDAEKDSVRTPIFFTTDPSFASDYSEFGGIADDDGMVKKSQVLPVVLKAKNLWDYENPAHVREAALALNLTPKETTKISEGDWRLTESPRFQQYLQDKNYDGFYNWELTAKNTAVFDGNQIKSPFNIGEFSLKNNDILRKTADNLSDTDKQDLIDYAALEILNDTPYQDVINKLEAVTGGELSSEQIRDIHAEAYQSAHPKGERYTSQEKKDLAKLRREHSKEAENWANREAIEAFEREKNLTKAEKDAQKAANDKYKADLIEQDRVAGVVRSFEEYDARIEKLRQKRILENSVPKRPSNRTLEIINRGKAHNVPDNVVTAALYLDTDSRIGINDLTKALRADNPDLSGGEALDIASRAAKFRRDTMKDLADERAAQRTAKATLEKKETADSVKSGNAARQLNRRVEALSKPPVGYGARVWGIRKSAMVSAFSTSWINLLGGIAARKINTSTDLFELAVNKGLAKIGRPSTNPNAIPADVEFKRLLGYTGEVSGGADAVKQMIKRDLREAAAAAKLAWANEPTAATVEQSASQRVLNEFPTEYERLFGAYNSDIKMQRDVLDTGLERAENENPVYKNLENVSNIAGFAADKALSFAETAFDKANFLNKWQEFAMRDLEFSRSLQKRLAARNLLLDDIIAQKDWKKIKAEDVTGAVDEALKVTFAKRPDPNSAAGRAIGFLHHTPVVSQLSNFLAPFANFTYNAIDFTTDYLPVGGLVKQARANQKNGGSSFGEGLKDLNSRDAAKQITGAIVFLAALGLVRALGDDDDWKKIRVPGMANKDGKPYHLDASNWFPFTPFIFMANKVNRLIDGKPVFTSKDGAAWEIIEGLTNISQRNIGDNQMIETAKALGDAIADDDEKAQAKASLLIRKMLGDELGTMLRPMKVLKDLSTAFIDSEVPDTLDSPFLGGLTKNLPAQKQILGAESKKRLDNSPVTVDAPILRIFGWNAQNPDYNRPVPSYALEKAQELQRQADSERDPLPEAQRKRFLKGQIYTAIRDAGQDENKQKIVAGAIDDRVKNGVFSRREGEMLKDGLGMTELQQLIKRLSLNEDAKGGNQVQKVLDLATPAELKELDSLITKKRANESKRENKEAGDKMIDARVASEKDTDIPTLNRRLIEEVKIGAITKEQRQQILGRVKFGETIFKIKSTSSADDAIEAFQEGMKDREQREKLVNALREKYKAAKSAENKRKYQAAAQIYGADFEERKRGN